MIRCIRVHIFIGLLGSVLMAGGATNSGPVMITITPSGPAEVAITWNTASNGTYNLQWSSDLQTNPWRSLAGLTVASGLSTSMTDSNSLPRRFYRVVTIQKIITLGETNSGSSVQLGAGDILELVLAENRTTGFQWDEVLGGAGIVVLAGAPQHQVSGGGLGAGGSVTYHFEPIAAGQTQLRFIYHRRFETNVPPARTVELTVTVK